MIHNFPEQLYRIWGLKPPTEKALFDCGMEQFPKMLGRIRNKLDSVGVNSVKTINKCT